MTPEERAKLEAKVFGGGGEAPPPKTADALPPDRAELERSTIGKPSADMDSAANAAGYAFIDKATLGALPWLRDKIADLAGNKDQLRRDEQRAYDEQNHPVASTTGAIAGTVAPAVLGAGAAGAAGLTSAAARGAVGAGGANLADQGMRKVLDDRPIDPIEFALSAAGGAVPIDKVLTGIGAVTHPFAAAGGWALRKGLQAAGRHADEAATAAARSPKAILDDIEAMAANVNKPPPTAKPAAPAAAAPGPEDLGAYAADDPLAEIARMARENARQARTAPGYVPPEAPIQPPPAGATGGFRPSKMGPDERELFGEALRSGRRMPSAEELAAHYARQAPPPPALMPESPRGLVSITGRQLLPTAAIGETVGTISGSDREAKKRKHQRVSR